MWVSFNTIYSRVHRFIWPPRILIGKKRKEENYLGKKVYWWFLLGLIIVICKNTFLDRNAAVCCKKLALGGSQDFWLMLGLTLRQHSMAQPTNHISTFVHCLFKVSAHMCIVFTLSLTRRLRRRWMVFPTNHISITMEKNLARTFSSNVGDHLCPRSSNLFLPTVFYFCHLVCLHYTKYTGWLIYLALPIFSNKKKHLKFPYTENIITAKKGKGQLRFNVFVVIRINICFAIPFEWKYLLQLRYGFPVVHEGDTFQ